MATKKNNDGQERDNEPQDEEQKLPGGPEVPNSMNIEDSKSDQEHLQQETSYIMLPEVSDIEGQEHITSIGPLGEMADTTASSDDEEGISNGKDLLGDDNKEEDIVMGTEADVTGEDLRMLGDADRDMDMGEDELIEGEGLDDTDLEGDPLNEGASDIFTTGDDLDIPGSEGNDPLADSMGQGDEENDYYSLDDNDDEVYP